MQPTTDLLTAIIDNLRRVFQAINSKSKKAELETGLTGPQLWAIKVLAESAPIKLSDLARKMYLHPATVVGIIDRLEIRGLVERNRSRKDRRVVEIGLTKIGNQIVCQSPAVAQGLLLKGLEELSDNKLAVISEGLEQLAMILEAKESLPQLVLSPEVKLPRRRIKKTEKQ